MEPLPGVVFLNNEFKCTIDLITSAGNSVRCGGTARPVEIKVPEYLLHSQIFFYARCTGVFFFK